MTSAKPGAVQPNPAVPGSAQPRKPKPQTVLTVTGTRWLSSHLVRVVALFENTAAFGENGFTDKYVKIHFARPELGLVPPYDYEALRKRLPPDDLPVTRTYTIRWIDRQSRELAIDFVVHGDEGLAGPWAANARPGDTLVVTGPGGGYAPDRSVDWHLFAGDDSAIPAIFSALEALPMDARGTACIEVDSESDVLPVTAPPGVDIQWLFRRGAPAGSVSILADAVAAMPFPDGNVQVFAHGERAAMKQLRKILLTDRGLQRSQLSLSGYWAYGRTEDRFQAEKREPVGNIFEDSPGV